MTVHIFQIGCRDFGKYGFEKLVDKERFFPEDVVLEGVCEKDFERREQAERFARSSGVELDFYDRVDELYDVAQDVDGTVLIYDAGPVQRHSDHIQRSLRNDFYHLAEKPPSLSREEHIAERKLATKHNVHYKVDFIERESPVIKKAREVVEKADVESIKVFRESSAGVQRILKPVEHVHMNEGCVLDKMIHDIYIMDFLEGRDVELDGVENVSFMPRSLGGEKLLRIDGGSSRDVSSEISLGSVSASFSADSTDISLNASWLGLSNEAKIYDRDVREKFDEDLTESVYSEIEDKGFLDEEARFFVIKEEKRTIVGDLLHSALYDLENGTEFDVDVYPRDQLYRVLERAIVDAAGGDVEDVSETELDVFMNALFDVQDMAGSKDIEVFDAVDSSTEKIRSMIINDKTELDKDDLKGVAS
ncbi:Gfo/Idh/MocA family oxidoreductase [Candidatus Nanohalobium constans]|uniref:Inositol 2-dehydrogenase n=1 Tax=Candidatus Nanohalobium constans TaxID=2565781 RepID=A0A5Q0UJ81_9ARCH|nr:Gfo/Idh/MocA family oxidoreductase [Candidatus Nanohalobium constans]QGA81015.1 inositol 2-dehydrogenase [Candidatus Nanohalobium constans]